MKHKHFQKAILLSVAALAIVILQAADLNITTFSFFRQEPSVSTQHIDSQLSDRVVTQLSKGGSFLLNEDFYLKFIKDQPFVGRPDGQFIIPKEQMDDLLKQASNDTQSLEIALGMKNLKDRTVYRVDIKNPLDYRPHLPSKELSGANDSFVEGGKTVGGLDEVVIEPAKSSDTSAYIVIQAATL